uniref:Reverse transcriptase zinc-binding domain-containing protein n=1 Tax=Setaria italica TaxID=4555 RepID=A0A0Q3VCM6_SETIT
KPLDEVLLILYITKDNLAKRRWQGSTKCCFCNDEETVQHLFFDCHLARCIWNTVFFSFGIQPPVSGPNMLVPIDPPKRLPRFRKEVMFADDIFLLGRDKLDLQIGDGKVLNKGAGSCQRHHYMYYDGGIFPCGFGGAVIDLEGDVIGMVHSSIDFIPSSTILKCLHLWRTFSCVPRIHLGMKCLGIKCLNLVSKEKISQKYRVDAGLIIVEGPFGKGIGCDSDVDVMVVLAVFNTTKRVSGRIQLMAKLSHDAEIIAIAIHLLSTLDQSLAQ